jgi:hypothetical protein
LCVGFNIANSGILLTKNNDTAAVRRVKTVMKIDLTNQEKKNIAFILKSNQDEINALTEKAKNSNHNVAKIIYLLR